MLDLFIELGASQYEVHHDGIWRQRGTAPYTVVQQAPQLSVGVRRGPWSLAYTHLGKVRSDAPATVADEFYVGGRCLQACGDLARFMGSGYVHGVALRRDFALSPRWSIEAGAFVYQPRWRVHVRDWWPGHLGATPEQGLRDFTVTARESIGISPTLALSYGTADVRLVARVYGMVTSGGAYNSLYHGQVYTLGVQMRF